MGRGKADKVVSRGAAEESREIILRISGISKSFGALRANQSVGFDLRKGQVLALLGENGAGKTTLMNILFGHYVADEGSIEVFGQKLPPGSPHAAIAAGIGMVHQHFALADNISVLDNIILGTEPSWRPYLRRKKARARLNEVMDESGLRVDPDALVGHLTVGQKQRVEILKALYLGARILILDEPTAVLTPQETEQLFVFVRKMVERGMSVIFISHKLKEVTAISERVVVLRGGKVVFEGKTAETGANELAHAMLGREIPERARRSVKAGEPVLVMQGVGVTENKVTLLNDVDIEIRRGEIVGVVGVSGNGQEPLFQILAGLRPPSRGTVSLFGEPLSDSTPAALVDRGVGRVPEDRHSTGLIVELSVWENLIAEEYRGPEFQRGGFVRRANALAFTDRIVKEFDVRLSSVHVPARLLSGGNMQKLILGRNLSRDPQLIIANQPTRGLDVGAVSFVHDRLLEAKERGAGVLLISEDLDELLGLADHLVVAFAGTISRPVKRSDVSIQKLGLMMMGRA